LGSSGPRQGLMAGSREDGDEPLGS